MSTAEQQPQLSTEETLQLMELTKTAVATKSLEEFAEQVLPSIAQMMHSCVALLYIKDPRLLTHRFFQHGFQPEASLEIERLCTEQFNRINFNPLTI